MSLIVFFSGRSRLTIFDCDLSSDVCSSDLCYRQGRAPRVGRAHPLVLLPLPAARSRPLGRLHARDRKSVVYGKSVDLGGRRIIKKKHFMSHIVTFMANSGLSSRKMVLMPLL